MAIVKILNGSCQSIFRCFIWPKLHDMWKIHEWAGHVTGYLSFQEIQWQQRRFEPHLHVRRMQIRALQGRSASENGALNKEQICFQDRDRERHGYSQTAILAACVCVLTLPTDLNLNPDTRITHWLKALHWNKCVTEHHYVRLIRTYIVERFSHLGHEWSPNHIHIQLMMQYTVSVKGQLVMAAVLI